MFRIFLFFYFFFTKGRERGRVMGNRKFGVGCWRIGIGCWKGVFMEMERASERNGMRFIKEI